jgi:excisionase family DNA binding protein
VDLDELPERVRELIATAPPFTGGQIELLRIFLAPLSADQAAPERLGYSVPEAAEVLGVSRALVYQLLRTGELRSLKLGRRRIIPRDALGELLGRPPSPVEP